MVADRGHDHENGRSHRLCSSGWSIYLTAVEAILRGVATGKCQPLLDRIFPLSQIAEAHRYLDSYDCVGKTVVLPGPVGARG
jgi:hypothetical protein